MLKVHNPSEFRELMEHRRDLWRVISDRGNRDVAVHFLNIRGDKYLHNEHLGWYTLSRAGVWVHNGSAGHGPPVSMRRSISERMQKEADDLERAERSAYAKSHTTMTEQQSKDMVKCLERIRSARAHFAGADYTSAVMTMVKPYCDMPDLCDKMDMSPYILAFTDAVYDLNVCNVRPIAPTDYVSMTTGYAYPKQSDPVARAGLKRLLSSLFENEETTNCLMRVLASCFLGLNRFEEYYVFTGSGGNGKGVIAELMRTVFGSYYTEVEISLFTKPGDRRDAPCPQLVAARNKRVMVTEEPESEDKLQAGFLKNLSGGNPIAARTLYSPKIWTFVPPFKIFILTNEIPKLTQMDGGSERRLRVVKFPFKFVASDKATDPCHRVGDPDVKERLCKSAAWRDEMCLMLTEVYATIKDLKSLPQPGEVSAATSSYVDANNPTKEWLETHYTITGSDKDRIGAAVLKQAYMADLGLGFMSDQAFRSGMEMNKGVAPIRKMTSGMVYTGLQRNTGLGPPFQGM